MDLLTQEGELTGSDMTALLAMEKEDLVELVVHLNRTWYRLLEELEDAHRLDLKRLEGELVEAFNTSSTSMQKSTSELRVSARENGKRLDSLKSVLEKLAENSSAGR